MINSYGLRELTWNMLMAAETYGNKTKRRSFSMIGRDSTDWYR